MKTNITRNLALCHAIKIKIHNEYPNVDNKTAMSSCNTLLGLLFSILDQSPPVSIGREYNKYTKNMVVNMAVDTNLIRLYCKFKVSRKTYYYQSYASKPQIRIVKYFLKSFL